MHLVRHQVGIKHYVSTQRTDRTGIDRKKLPQDNKISYSLRLNPQSIINISKERLCKKASPETRDAWKKALHEIEKIDHQLYLTCVPKCIYRGFCPELKTCGYAKTVNFNLDVKVYRT